MRPAVSGRLEDRQFHWLLALLIVIPYASCALPGGFVFDPVAREAMTADSSNTFKLVWIPLMAAALVFILLRFRMATLLLGELNKPLLLFLAYALASSVWAPDPGRALRQAFSIFGPVLLAVAFAMYSWRRDRLESVLLPLSTLMLVLSLIVAIAIPGIGIHNENQFELLGAWRGITYQKNGLGQLSAITLILWCHAWVVGRARLSIALAGMALSVFLLIKSRSSTALVMSMLSCLVIVMLCRPPLRLGQARKPAVFALTLAILAPLVVYFVLVGSFNSESSAQALGSIFGKDATFSGRTLIWAEVLRVIPSHPWIGIGFSSFWFTPAADETVRRLGWPCPSGHNGYLDLVNTVGVFGFGIFLAFMVIHLRTLRAVARFDRGLAALHLGLFLFVSLTNLTESGWFVPITQTHFLIMLSSVALSRAVLDHKLGRARPQAGPSITADARLATWSGSAGGLTSR